MQKIKCRSFLARPLAAVTRITIANDFAKLEKLLRKHKTSSPTALRFN